MDEKNKAQLKRPLKSINKKKRSDDEFIRPEREDDDGYDPYSDRPAKRSPLFEEDPWR